MSRVVEIDERGILQLPDDFLAAVKPYTRFVMELQGATLILRPEHEQPFLVDVVPEKRAEAIRYWATLDRPDSPVLPDEALRRESMYD